MARQFTVKARFQQRYDRLTPPEQLLVKKSLGQFQHYLDTGEMALGLGLRKLGSGVYEFRAGLALRILSVEEGALVVLDFLGSHDEVRRFLKRR